MDYSIKSFDNQTLVSDHQKKYIEWKINLPFEELYDEYKAAYSIQNDVCFLDVSYFNILCNLLKTHDFSISNLLDFISEPNFFLLESTETKSHIQNIIYQTKLQQYQEQKINDDTAIELAEQDTKNIVNFTSKILQNNYVIMSEFKSFALGFTTYVKNKHIKEHSNFQYIYEILKNDFIFFRTSKIESIKKYTLSIGSYSQKHNYISGKINSFVPCGLCYYGKSIFINNNVIYIKNFGTLWEKRTTLKTFYHEIGHALDYLYDNESILKNKSYNKYSSHNRDFLKCCKLNYINSKKIKHKTHYRTHETIDYYCTPKTKRLNDDLLVTKEYVNPSPKLNKTNTGIENILGEFQENPKKKLIHTKLKFSPIFSSNLVEYDYKRTLQESWSESFSFIFYWLKNSFTEYDEYTIKADKSSERILIKSLYHSMIYILYNVDWSKLNISYNVVLRKRKKIRDFLDFVYKMPLYINGDKCRKIQSKKYPNIRAIKK